MKTVVRKNTNVSLYLLADDVEIALNSENMIVGNPPLFIVLDCNIANAAVYENVSDPDEWAGWKYLFDGVAWTLNPDYVPPPTRETV